MNMRRRTDEFEARRRQFRLYCRRVSGWSITLAVMSVVPQELIGSLSVI